MNLKKYVENLNEYLRDNPDHEEFAVISASDDEGNSYREVYYEPGAFYFDGDESISGDDEEGLEDYGVSVNAVCIN